ncbi:transposase [Streptomyces cadmiisoli]|uniref:transposase n=1 Tax=Streptomyces cadmiisoli TaxID=2184053 RepID=UPI0013A6E7FB|nr:transposase [Streptomyces cadmiisoli]
MKKWLHAVAAEFGGRPGERLGRRLHLGTGRSRPLGLLESPSVPDRALRILGVYEFAFREGRTYGALLVDVEADRVVDILPDRTSEIFANWLREHPGTEIV